MNNRGRCSHGFYIDEDGKHIEDKELEKAIKYWDEYFAKNQGKIPNTFPKTFFDNEE
jgi:hypothetical protein